jgi:ABC-type Na+ transport system ATPase subunit NatA
MKQNYFQVHQEYYEQTDGLSMGAPTSSMLAETYMQHMEHKQIYPILTKQQILAYFRYVDDMIYNQRKTNIEHTIEEFNKLQLQLQQDIFIIKYSVGCKETWINRP